jgi:hypothetical protein
MKKNKSRKPVGNSGLYGRVTKKQMGGAAKPVGMSGPGFLAGEIPPDGSGPSRGIVAGNRTPYDKYIPKIDFDNFSIDASEPTEEDMQRIKAKKDYLESRMRSGSRTEKDPRTRNRRSMPSREELQSIADAMSGKAVTGGGRRRGGIFDRLRDQARRRTESPYEPKMPGGGRQTPPMTGPNPDVGKMFPRRIEGLGATLVDALGIKSQGMGDRKRKEPPRPSPKRGSMTRQRRR